MAILLNRKYSSRIECLYYILKTTLNNFGKDGFLISDIRYDSNAEDNILNHCELLEENLGIKYCPFLDNPLNDSKCYATQSLDYDTTKAKAASSVVRAWEALGFTKLLDGKFIITPIGEEFTELDFNQKEWFEIVRRSVLSYGPVIGYLWDAFKKGENFNSSRLYVSYPITDDPIELSTFSTKDSNTRTVSLLTSWCIQAGLIEPENNRNENESLPHIFYRDYINAKRLTIRKFILTSFAKEYLEGDPYIENPLSYNNLNKNVGSLRERNSESIRNTTQQYNSIILNRRFAIIYILNNNDKEISFDDLISLFNKYYEDFFLPNSKVEEILQSELAICLLTGLLLKYKEVNNKLYIQRCSKVNNEALMFEAPSEIIELAEKMVKEL